MPQAKHAHLPDILYGGIGKVAELMDELGSEASVSELSCAIVNVCRVAAQNQKDIAKLKDQLTGMENALRASLAVANDRITDLATRVGALEVSTSPFKPGEFAR